MKRPSITGFLACDAIEAAFLRDGPGVEALRTIEHPNSRAVQELQPLRAFLYSLQATHQTSWAPYE